MTNFGPFPISVSQVGGEGASKTAPRHVLASYSHRAGIAKISVEFIVQVADLQWRLSIRSFQVSHRTSTSGSREKWLTPKKTGTVQM